MATVINTERATVELDVTLRCSECDAELEAEYEESTSYGNVTRELKVGPCPKCLEAAKKEGHDEGREEALLEGDDGPPENEQPHE